MPVWVYGLLFGFVGIVAYLCWWGWRERTVDFLHDVRVGFDAEEARQRFLDRAIPFLVASDFRSVGQSAHTTVMERRYVLGWTIALAFLLFPFGLLALLVRGRDRIVIASSGDSIRLHGSCPKSLADGIVEELDHVAGVSAAASP
jgi:hypothetical protein